MTTKTNTLPVLGLSPQTSGLNYGAWITRALAIAHQRHALRRLDAHALDDIGVSRTQAGREANRWFWDLPGRWLCEVPALKNM
ncbi:MAG: DUF1127 domain-containing protein [Paracoccaceae bacterium]